VQFIRFKEIDSTQRVAREVAMQDASDLTTVWADIQTHGIGRYNRQWFSNEGGLWMTTVIRRPIPVTYTSYIALSAGYRIFKLLESLGVETQIKYPNDIMAIFGRSLRKLSGILCQSVLKGNFVEFVLVGVGMNVNNTVPHMAVSLCELTNKKWNIEDLAPKVVTAVSEGFDDLVQNGPKRIFDKLVSSGCREIPLDLMSRDSINY
jgi:BirA family biotin operon repressor/biotin-[acetyl-CoA-carboxylase] ligase